MISNTGNRPTALPRGGSGHRGSWPARAIRCGLGLLVLVLPPAGAARAQETPPGLYDRPVLILDPGVHMAMITHADVDAAGAIAVTGSHDKTVRIWSARTGDLLRTIRLPRGPGNVGKVYAVAISPDGELVAAGGWTRWSDTDRQEQIYLFDRKTGALVRRIEGLPNQVAHLVFSHDGRYLAATLGGANGLRVYDRDAGWDEIARDEDYGGVSYGAAFAADGRLATTSIDGHLRLYDRAFQRVATSRTEDGARPNGIAFNPEVDRLAVGYHDRTAVSLFDARDLTPLAGPYMRGIGIGSTSYVAWSADGATLYAGGQYRRAGTNLVLAWSYAGAGPPRELAAGQDTIMSLRPLPDGGLLVGDADPYLAVLDAEGAPRWEQRPQQADPRGQTRTRSVSADGGVVDFSFQQRGRAPAPARFDLARLALSLDPPEDGLTAPPEQGTLKVKNWNNKYWPTLDGKPLSLEPYEMSRSLAIHPDDGRFVLGTDWWLRAFDADGEALWQWPVPGAVWAVSITADGRLVVAAYGDGTIRWHRMDDGSELLAFFPFSDGRNWVVWEPDGRFASTVGARSALYWLFNKGWDDAPVTVPASQIPKSFRPEVIKRVLPTGGTMEAVYAAEETERRLAIKRLTGSDIAPGTQLHVLTVGVSTYGARASRINLEWADDDARDLHAALSAQTEDIWPYQRGFSMVLQDDDATRLNIRTQLDKIRERMEAAPGKNDLAVIHFSGHGLVIGDGADREFYLLPHDVDLHSSSRIENSALSSTDLRRKVAAMAEHGRVLLLLDACRSGAAGALDAELLRRNLAGRNVTVLTSSSAEQPSREESGWRNGAFTEVLLQALGRAGDTDGNGMVSTDELVGYVVRDVQALTNREQKPTVEQRFSGELFASQL